MIQNNRQEQMVFYGGGGICMSGSGTPVITRNLIRNNRAMRGGGIFIQETATPIIYDNRFEDNYAAYFGGGIMVNSNGGVRTEDGTLWRRLNTPIMPEDTNIYADNLHGSAAIDSPPVDTGGADVYFLDGGVHNLTQDSWHATLPAALDASINGDEIVAYPRNYPAGLNFNGKNVTLRSLDPANPEVVAATTIEGSVKFFNGETHAAKLQGFTIRNGVTSLFGGGIAISGASPHILNNVIVNNRQTMSGVGNGGGGIAVRSAGTNPIIEQNIIAGNSATHGGGIYIRGGADPRIENNHIFDNTTAGVGGGICLDSVSPSFPWIRNNVIVDNIASGGGGIDAVFSGARITDNIIAGNRATNVGGGIRSASSGIYGDVVAAGANWPFAHVPPASEATNTYTIAQAAGSIQVDIFPAAARTAGALWSDDGVGWHESGTSVSRQAGGLNAHGDPAVHTTGSDVYFQGVAVVPIEPVDVPERNQRAIQFNALDGWHSPAEITVLPVHGQNRKVAAVYTRTTGAVQVTLEPEAARTAGVRWRVANSAWTASDGIVDALPTGQYTVEFRGTENWFPPDSMTVTVTADATTAVTRTFYTKAATVSGIVVANRVYDGSVVAALDVSGAVLVGVEAGDSVSLEVGQVTGAFDTAAAGVNKPVAVGGLSLGGPDAHIYKLIQPTVFADIAPRPLAVVAHDQQKVYGEADPDPTWEITSGSLVPGDALSGFLIRDQGEQAGQYVIGQGTLAAGDNYVLTFIAGLLTIAKATPTVFWPEPAAIVYGTALGAMQYNATASLAGTFSYTPPTGTVLGAALAQELRADFTPDEAANWNSVASMVGIDVTPAPLTCVAVIRSKVIGSSNPPLVIRYQGLQHADTAPKTPPTIDCIADETSPVGIYPITLSGGADPNYSLTLVDGLLTVVAGESFRVWLEDGARAPIPGPEFGETADATNGFDEAFDVVASEGAGVRVYLLNTRIANPAQQRLIRDYRPVAVVNRWRLVVENMAGQGHSLVLRWNTDAAAALERELYLQEVRDEQAIGFPIDMRRTTLHEISGDREYEIAYAPRLEPAPEIKLSTGWNLVGSPVMSMQSISEIFDDDARATANLGSAWQWHEGLYETGDPAAPLNPERGYWVYCQSDGVHAPITGVKADGVMLLKSGWNLVSPADDWIWQDIDGIADKVWYWDSQPHAYRAATGGDQIKMGQYWVYVSSDEPVWVKFAE